MNSMVNAQKLNLGANHPDITIRKMTSEETVDSQSVFKKPGLYLSNDGGIFYMILYNINGFGWNFSFNWAGIIQVREVVSNKPRAWVTIAGPEQI